MGLRTEAAPGFAVMTDTTGHLLPGEPNIFALNFMATNAIPGGSVYPSGGTYTLNLTQGQLYYFQSAAGDQGVLSNGATAIGWPTSAMFIASSNVSLTTGNGASNVSSVVLGQVWTNYGRFLGDVVATTLTATNLGTNRVMIIGPNHQAVGAVIGTGLSFDGTNLTSAGGGTPAAAGYNIGITNVGGTNYFYVVGVVPAATNATNATYAAYAAYAQTASNVVPGISIVGPTISGPTVTGNGTFTGTNAFQLLQTPSGQYGPTNAANQTDVSNIVNGMTVPLNGSTGFTNTGSTAMTNQSNTLGGTFTGTINNFDGQGAATNNGFFNVKGELAVQGTSLLLGQVEIQYTGPGIPFYFYASPSNSLFEVLYDAFTGTNLLRSFDTNGDLFIKGALSNSTQSITGTLKVGGPATFTNSVLVESNLGVFGVLNLLPTGSTTAQFITAAPSGLWDYLYFAQDGSTVEASMDTNGIQTVNGQTNLGLSASSAMVTDANKKVVSGGASAAQIAYLGNVNSDVQMQINGKQPTNANLTTLAGNNGAGLTNLQGTNINGLVSAAPLYLTNSGTNVTVSFGTNLYTIPLNLTGNLNFTGPVGSAGPASFLLITTGTNVTLSWPTNAQTPNTNGLTLVGTNYTLTLTNPASACISFFASTNSPAWSNIIVAHLP
jgi:hypothetical protein